jgi:formylglycine-generating enzyme required for sulfatase activity
MKLMYVPAGEFQMGSTDDQYQAAVLLCVKEGFKQTDCQNWFANEKPVHTVYLDAFWIDQMDVTNAIYDKCVRAGSCKPPQCNETGFTGDRQPVVCVDWNQADTYCKWAGRVLPSEAQWEKAAHGTDGRIYPWGNQELDKSLLNYNGNLGKTTDVGSYPSGASPYGALDIAGNVYQWVADWYGSSYYSNSPQNNPTGPETGQYRVLRGGSWHYNDIGTRSTNRFYIYPTAQGNLYGFRCAVSHP